MSLQIECSYRKDIRQHGELEVADCHLLYQITGGCDKSLVTVRAEICEGCCKQSRPSHDVLNPTMASLVNRTCEKIIKDGVPGYDIQKVERLKKWSYDCIPFVPSKSNPLGVWRGFHEVTCDQHPDGNEISRTPCIHLTRSISHVIGQGFHRSGWPYAVRSLMPMFCQQGILFDDFVEQRFCYEGDRQIYTSPWIGVFHHPGHVPTFIEDKYSLEQIFKGTAWRESEKHLRGAIALSEHLAQYLSSRLQVPIVVVKHPSEIPQHTWSEEAYLQNTSKKLVQFGWYLRNTRAIYQLPLLRDHEKFRCLPEKPWIAEYDTRISAHWQSQGSRTEYGQVTELGYVSHELYDSLLTSNVAMTELFEASANNVVIECIARNTPLIVNRHPAAVEYLTPGYPLFFDDLAEVPALLTTERVIAAHRYLRDMNKEWLKGENFCNSIRDGLKKMDLSRPTRVRHKNIQGNGDIEGWYETRFDTILQQIDEQQEFGHIGEIGVHHGKSFIHLCKLRSDNESALAVDCFDQQEHNRSHSGNGRKSIFLRNVDHLKGVRILEGNSLDFTASDYMAAVGGRFRIFHVDGGHDVETALHDLTEASKSLSVDGVLIVDDVFNQDWPEVSQALYQFVAISDLKPFAIAYNKVCLSRRSYRLKSPRYVKSWLGHAVQIM